MARCRWNPGGAGQERQVGDHEPLELDIRGEAEEENKDRQPDHDGLGPREERQEEQHDDR